MFLLLGEEAPLLSMDVQATEKGLAIVEEMLRAFANESKRQKGGDDVAALVEVVNRYKERALNDPWVQRALESL
jgi:hypothetical protein